MLEKIINLDKKVIPDYLDTKVLLLMKNLMNLIMLLVF